MFVIRGEVENPEAVTRDKVMAALPGLEALAQQLVDSGGIPGLSVAVVYRDEVVYRRRFR
jgi:hypothetical protein